MPRTYLYCAVWLRRNGIFFGTVVGTLARTRPAPCRSKGAASAALHADELEALIARLGESERRFHHLGCAQLAVLDALGWQRPKLVGKVDFVPPHPANF